MSDSAYVQAKSVLDALMLSYQLANAVRTKRILPPVLLRELVIRDERGKGITITPTGDSESVMVVVENLRKYLIGTCFIVFDRALDKTFGNKPADYSSDNEVDNLRLVIYMLRCAYAHNPALPNWRITHERDRRLVCVKRLDMTLDLKALHGQPFGVGQCGGWDAIHRLLLYALGVIQSRSDDERG